MPRVYISAAERRLVMERAQGRCEYCQCTVRYANDPFVVEHIIPLARGGTSITDNLAFACAGCNGHKYSKVAALDPVSDKEVSLFHPRQQHWTDHFGWSADYLRIIGLTPSGRATVEALQMNRTGIVNLRELLYLARKHPLVL
jgi:hypothetical protein